MLTLLLGGLTVVVAVVGMRFRDRRVRLWRNWCRARDWVFSEKVPAVVDAFRGGPFGRGSGPQAFWGYEGTFDGLPVQGFQYRFATGVDEETNHHYNVDVLHLGGRLPRLEISRESWRSRTFGADIQFENAAFNREWRVVAESAKFAHDVIHPRTMQWLLGDRALQFVHLWFENGCLLVTTSGPRNPDQVDAHLRLLTEFASHLPRFVLDEVGVGPLPLTWDGPGVTSDEQAARMARLTSEK